MTSPTHLAFATRQDLETWLAEHHASERELWVRMYKKGTGVASVTWDDLVLAGLAWGWIDGQRRALDEVSFVQRISPRRPKSTWSKRNCALAERLIAEGRMQPSGLRHVEAARADGRWEQAYDGSAAMTMPDDFLAALRKDRAAKAFFAKLDRRNLFSVYHRVTTARRPETRAKRIAEIVAKLSRGEAFHPR